MSRPPRPVFWKPRYPTRSMRERAWAKQSLERERTLQRPRGRLRDGSLLRRLIARLGRG